jgi:hypothetical protein
MTERFLFRKILKSDNSFVFCQEHHEKSFEIQLWSVDDELHVQNQQIWSDLIIYWIKSKLIVK